MGSGKPAIVKQLPRRFIKGELEQFSRDVQVLLSTDRPRLIFDFSGVQEIDRMGAEALLEYLRLVLTGNGDIKLACLPASVGLVLELTGIDRVFETYPSVIDALESFYSPPGRRVEEFGQQRDSGWVQPGWLEIAG